MSTHEILIPFAVLVGSAALVSWINIKIKFAPTEAQAKKDIRRIFLIIFGVLQWVAFAYLLWWIIKQFMADTPITTRNLMWILLAAFGLFHTYMMVWIWLLMLLLGKFKELLFQNVDVTMALMKHAEKTASRKGGA